MTWLSAEIEPSNAADQNHFNGASASVPFRYGDVTDVDVRSLPAGTFVTVDTRNSRYRLTMCDDMGRTAVVQGGKLFPEETVARVEGSTLGGNQVRVGWIDVGFCLELFAAGERVVTSRVRSISID